MKHLISGYFVFITLACFSQPGKDGAFVANAPVSVLNRYTPLTQDVFTGDSTLHFLNVPGFSLCPGDLILIYQAQGATVNTSDSPQFGDILSHQSAGLYEFKYVNNSVNNTVKIKGSLLHAYTVLSGHAQIIKVPQFSTLTVNNNCSVVCGNWRDSVVSNTTYRFGGVLAIHSSQIVNNGTISASGKGFRGGAIRNNTYILGVTTYRSTSIVDGGEKGESICGYQADYDTYGGRYSRGAPANGGGGGSSTNSGGGGGANTSNGNMWNGQGKMTANSSNPIQAWMLDPGFQSNGNMLTNSSGGGRGGYSWGNWDANALVEGPGNSQWQGDNRRCVGGLGGRPLTNIVPESRIYFGGGGGAGDANNGVGTGGGNGGGIVYLIATNGISGTGSIKSDGLSVPTSPGCSCDGMGGGGAGGSVIINSPNIISQNISANGAAGGDQILPSNPAPTHESEGPGGGGGGGLIAMSSTASSVQTNGGANGQSFSTGVSEMMSNGATSGAPGYTTGISALFPGYTAMPVKTNTPVCLGSTVNFFGVPILQATYLWTGPNNFFSTVPNPVFNASSGNVSGIYSLQVSHVNGCIETATVAVFAEVCNSITGSSKIDFRIYPNPTTSGYLTIECETDVDFIIQNMWGCILTQQKTPRGVSIINLGAFGKGVYFISSINGNRSVRQKIVYL